MAFPRLASYPYLVLAASLFFLCGCSPTPPSQVCSEFEFGLRHCSLEHGDMQRTYSLYIPDSYAGDEGVPLVLDFHGATSPPALQRWLSGVKQNADKHGFIAVWPAGIGTTFNGATCCDFFGTNVDDVGFTRAIVAQVSSMAMIDQNKVYATGLSNGAAMAHRLGCEASDLFSAIAPVSFALPDAEDYPCTPANPVPVIVFHSLHDSALPYEGGSLGKDYPLIQFDPPLAGAVDGFEHWAEINACIDEPREVYRKDESYCLEYDDCENGVRTQFCTLHGENSIAGGHVAYLNDHKVPVDELIWEFLQAAGK